MNGNRQSELRYQTLSSMIIQSIKQLFQVAIARSQDPQNDVINVEAY